MRSTLARWVLESAFSGGTMGWQALVATVVAFLLVWLLLVGGLYASSRRQDDPATLRSVLRLLPDVVRLARRLAADPGLPRGVRLRLLLLVVYLVFPLDLVPDFIPVVGHADDALVVLLVLRSVIRCAGTEALDRHWPGTPDGLHLLKRLTGTPRPA
jgi:uncharacterized membrane protein YkvA (DUF1232 family)